MKDSFLIFRDLKTTKHRIAYTDAFPQAKKALECFSCMILDMARKGLSSHHDKVSRHVDPVNAATAQSGQTGCDLHYSYSLSYASHYDSATSC